MKKIFYITGVSGTGKSTVILELQKMGYIALDLDKGFCHWKHNTTKERAHFTPGIGREFLEAHDWYCDVEKLTDFLDSASGVVFVAGVTANQDEYLSLFDKIFFFKTEPEIFFKRVDERSDNEFGKHASEKEHMLGWYKDYESEMLAQGAIVIDTDKPVRAVVDELLTHRENT